MGEPVRCDVEGGAGVTRTVSQAIATTGVILIFLGTVGGITLRDAIAATIMVYPFAYLFCKYVVRES